MKKLHELMLPESKTTNTETVSESTALGMLSDSHAMLRDCQETDWIGRLLATTAVKTRRKVIVNTMAEAAKKTQQKKSELAKEVAQLQIRAEQSINEAMLLNDHYDQIAAIKESADNEFISQAVRSLTEKKRQLEMIRAMNVDPELAAQVEQHVIASFHGNVNKHLGQTIELG